jgi:hypothetical protein
MTSSYTTNKNIEKPGNGDYVNTWSSPVNTDWDIVDTCFGGTTTLTSTSGSTTLSTAQYRTPIINCTGTLTGNVTYTIPSGVGGLWTVYNNTTASYTVTFSSGGGGSSVAISQGTRAFILSDGTNIALCSTQPVTPAGSNTQIQFNNNGSLGASSNFVWTGSAVGIGTSSPGYTLAVNGTIGAGAISCSSVTNSGALSCASASISGAATVGTTLGVSGSATVGGNLTVSGTISGSFGAISCSSLSVSGSASLSSGLTVSGAITATGNVTAYYSDIRLKDVQGPITGALDKVSSLNGFYYRANDTAKALGYTDELQVGLSAQDVEAVMPEVIHPAPIDKQYKTLNYGHLVPLLIEAIKELRQEVETLKAGK